MLGCNYREGSLLAVSDGGNSELRCHSLCPTKGLAAEGQGGEHNATRDGARSFCDCEPVAPTQAPAVVIEVSGLYPQFKLVMSSFGGNKVENSAFGMYTN